MQTGATKVFIMASKGLQKSAWRGKNWGHQQIELTMILGCLLDMDYVIRGIQVLKEEI